MHRHNRYGPIYYDNKSDGFRARLYRMLRSIGEYFIMFVAALCVYFTLHLIYLGLEAFFSPI